MFFVNTIRRWIAERPAWPLWACLLLITAAELLIALVNVPAGLALHAMLLIGLTLFGALGEPRPERNLMLALTLVPLIRLLSLSLPLGGFPQLAWYPMVSLPMFIASWRAIRLLGLSRRELGITNRSLVTQVGFAGGGLGLGAIEYMILRPEPLITGLSWTELLLAALVLIVFVGFLEELVFRGLLQSLGLRAMGGWALLYVSLLFAALHIGYGSAMAVTFAFVAAMLFASIVRYSGSIVGTSLSHGMTNVTLFLIMPYLAQQPWEAAETLAHRLIWAGTAMAALAIVTMTRSDIFTTAVRCKALISRSIRHLQPATAQPCSDPVQATTSSIRPPVQFVGCMERDYLFMAGSETLGRPPRQVPLCTPKTPYVKGGQARSEFPRTLRHPIRDSPHHCQSRPRASPANRRRYTLPLTLALLACTPVFGAHCIYALVRWMVARNTRAAG